MNDLHFSKLKEALEKKDINIWNEFVSKLDVQIDLSDADLRNANLFYTNLSCAKLYCADLNDADLSHANLNHTNLKNANLYDADLKGADLSDVDLRNTNTYGIADSIFKGSKHFAVQIGRFISIGCYTLEISEWIKRADKITTKENYTNEEKNEYLKYINECKEKMMTILKYMF